MASNPPPDPHPPFPPHDPEVPFTHHLIELRKRLIHSLAAVGLAFLVTINFSQQIMDWVEAPVKKHVASLQFDTLTDPFLTHFKMAFYAAIFFTFPYLLLQVWLFVRPALYKKERQTVWPFLVFSYPLFVLGAIFVYRFIFPIAFSYFINFDPTLVPSIRVGEYLAMVLQMMLVFGLVFELPLIALVLGRLGLITAGWLHRVRRYAYLVIFVVAAILTPPDVISQLLMAGPLLVLYEISVVVVWATQPRRKKKPTDNKEAPAPSGLEKK